VGARPRIKIKAGKSSDPEKMVLPGMLFCRSEQDGAKGFALAVGWWDYHVTLLFAQLTPLQNTTGTS